MRPGKFSPFAWFWEMWPRGEGKRAVIRDYLALREMPHLLADIALRGHVFSAWDAPPGDVFGAGVMEGRRRLALELLELTGMPPQELWGFIERAPTNRGEGDDV